MSPDDLIAANVLVVARKRLWERDFLGEIIPVRTEDWKWIEFGYGTSRGSQALRMLRCTAVAPMVGGGVLAFSSNHLGLREVRWLIRLARPKVLVHLSDEWGVRPDFAGLASEVDLVVRQHHHGAYAEPRNVVHMPLGYMNGMLGGRSSTALDSLPPIASRCHVWSFAGDAQKQDRPEALSLFAQWRDGVCTEGIPPANMFELYRNSVFVPSPRGNVRLDCFRLYEASLAGAIPVVVGSPEELSETFCKEESPPWIFAFSWADAVAQCEREMNQPEQLQERQERLLAWWRERVAGVRGRVHEVLEQHRLYGARRGD